jgi:pimeloyl-ACP methyl ester carboxylesterase/DNA-binding CsgD family transcriptional regulator
MPPNIRFCRSSDGVRIAFGAQGTGAPLVEAPTWMTHLEFDWECAAWRPWVAELCADHMLVRYDLRGCGLSDRDVADLSLESWVADLEAVVEALGLDRFPLFGLCQGGVIAAAYAARHPERVSRLVLYGSYVQGALAQASGNGSAEVEALATLIETGWGRSLPAFRQVFAHMLMPEAPPENVRALAEMERHSATPEVARRLWIAFHSLDISELAPQIRVPTLVAHCRHDGMVPFAEGRRLATLIPGARFVALDSCNHILQLGEPCWSRLWGEVHRFLAPEESAVSAPAHSAGKSALYPDLTPRERELLDLIARARSNAEIAEELGISPRTVRNHITNIFAKLGVSRRAEAIVLGRDIGFGGAAASGPSVEGQAVIGPES